ncbi:unnamed protein product [Ophioblennius macclurei]
MKKSKSWIHNCVRFLLLIILTISSYSAKVSPVTDDISKLFTLKHNIPKDYKIPVHYVPKEEGGMCWVKLNVFSLESSLHDLAHKFGNISSNRNDISVIIVILQDLRFKLGPVDLLMYEFECHYREERWPTERYFDFLKEYLIAAKNEGDSYDCHPPPCPVTPDDASTEAYTEAPPTPRSEDPECLTGCTARKEPRLLPEVVERSLLSLLFIPLLALAFLLVWKVRSRRNGEDLDENAGESGVFTGTEGTAPPLDAEISEKNMLNVIETV